ncbi:MAG TPA: hypothetical protein VJV79_39715 [Polyangiaceae bacterium]|nr:hypothetical protein [Polyangiaceae bacterium]
MPVRLDTSAPGKPIDVQIPTGTAAQACATFTVTAITVPGTFAIMAESEGCQAGGGLNGTVVSR